MQCLKLKTQWMIWTAVNVQKEFVKCIRKIFLDCSIENEKMEKIKRHGEKRGNWREAICEVIMDEKNYRSN